MRRRGRRVAILLGAGVLALAALLAVERERVADLIHALRTGYWFEWMPEGVVPGRNGTNILNDAGDVAVDIVEVLPMSDMRAAVWSPAEADLRPLAVLEAGSASSHSLAINDRGWIVGTIAEPIPSVFRRAFLWTPATGATELPGLVKGAHIAPADINDRGEVVGSARGSSGRMRAFSWEIGSTMRDLGVLSEVGESYAVAINDHGWIAGNARDIVEVVEPVLWKPGSGIQALGTFPGAANSHANDINNRCEVLVIVEMVGSASGARITKPVLWTEERGYEELPIPPGQEWFGGSINDRGEVLLSAKDAWFLISGGEVKELPGARKGITTRYLALNNHGWLAGSVELEEDPWKRPSSVRGFVARPR